jgi:outer membrane protein OmpA-like peptidoglycan-associated protein
MDNVDTHNYVNFRLARAGCSHPSLFTAKSLDTIWKVSGGTPRLINQLCEHALNAACHKGKKRVERREVKQAVNDPLYQPMFISEAKSWSMRTGFAGTVLALFFGLSFGLWYLGIGSKFLPETTTAVSHLAAEHRTLIKKPMIRPSHAKKGGKAPVNSGAIIEGTTLPVHVSGEAITVEPESQTPRTTHTASPLEHFGEDLGSSAPMLATDDLPGFKLSAIAWDADPARCIAVVNDRIVHEGDFLGEVRVLRIKPDHIVMIYGNEHIIKGIHTWEGDQVNGEEQENKASERDNQEYAEQSVPHKSFRAIVNFDFRASALAPEASHELDRVASLALQSPDHEIIIFGYTDNVGSREYNKRLSESRANIVATHLVEKGIDPERIQTIGMGEKNPVMPNSTPEGRAANRRVEIELVPSEDTSDSLAGG